MSSTGIKISDLNDAVTVPEFTVIPLVSTGTGTLKCTLDELRSSLGFSGTGFSSITLGIQGTPDKSTFFVYTDATNTWVLQYLRSGSSAAPVTDANGVQVKLPTQKQITAIADILTILSKSTGASLVYTQNGDSIQDELNKFPTLGTSPTSPVVRGQFDITPSPTATWGLAGIGFGGDANAGQILIDEKGRLKSSAVLNGKSTNQGLMFATVENYYTEISNYQVKVVRFPSDGYEDDDNSPGMSIWYSSTGQPKVTFFNPKQFNGYGWPRTNGQNSLYRDVLFADDLGNYRTNTLGQNNTTSVNYMLLATWDLSSIPWGSEIKLLVTGDNTGDRFVSSYVIESNVQSPQTTSFGSYTALDYSKIFKMKYDGAAGAVLPGAVVQTAIFGMGVTLSGTALSLYLTVPQKTSSTFTVTPIIVGDSKNLTLSLSSPLLTAVPTNIVYLPVLSEWNGVNSSMANDGSIVKSDIHVRLTTDVNSTARTDILSDGFFWAGAGAVKSHKDVVSIAKTGTGVYVVTGATPQTTSWQIKQPTGLNGDQVAWAVVSATGSKTVTISVFAITWVYNSANGTVTRTQGAAMDIPSNCWVDLNLKLSL